MKNILLKNATVVFDSDGEGAMSLNAFVPSVPTMEELYKAAGLFYPCENERDKRIHHIKEHDGIEKLVLEEDISMHGSPTWKLSAVLEDNPVRIEEYLLSKHAFAIFKKRVEERQNASKSKEMPVVLIKSPLRLINDITNGVCSTTVCADYREVMTRLLGSVRLWYSFDALNYHVISQVGPDGKKRLVAVDDVLGVPGQTPIKILEDDPLRVEEYLICSKAMEICFMRMREKE